MRLIDADALESNGICFAVHGGAKFISLESVRTAPTIEAEPVKHGRWVSIEAIPHSYYRCSECGDEWGYGATLHMNFCPNCGAKMDGGDE